MKRKSSRRGGSFFLRPFGVIGMSRPVFFRIPEEDADGLGMGVVKALMAAGGITQDKVPELLIFHAFQTDVDAQLAGGVDGGPHHRLGVFVLQNMEDKALVDLRAVRRQVADQAQGGDSPGRSRPAPPGCPGSGRTEAPRVDVPCPRTGTALSAPGRGFAEDTPLGAGPHTAPGRSPAWPPGGAG